MDARTAAGVDDDFPLQACLPDRSGRHLSAGQVRQASTGLSAGQESIAGLSDRFPSAGWDPPRWLQVVLECL